MSALLATGCSALVNPDLDELGGENGVDAGISLLDSGPPGQDAAVGIDGGPLPIDGGPVGSSCTSEGSSRCEGEDLLICAGGMENRTSCQTARAFCEVGPSGAGCTPWRCEPNTATCSEGGSMVCDARGSNQSFEPCNCDPTTGRCGGGTPTSCGDVPVLTGVMQVNLCERDNDNLFVDQNDCQTAFGGARAGDAMFRIVVESRRTVRIRVRDEDPSRSVDTVAYLRRACEDPASQVICADDVACGSATLGCNQNDWNVGRGSQVRESVIETQLEPGTYFLVVDAYEYQRDGDFQQFGCGRVSVRLE